MSRNREPYPGVFGLLEPIIRNREKNLDFARRADQKQENTKWHSSVSGKAGDAAYQQARQYYAGINQPFPEDDPLTHEEEQKRGLVIPPFKYLGPGNSLNRGNPYNNIDSDAKEHDEAYNSAKTVEDIQRADTNFINKSIDHTIEGIAGKGDIGDTIGGIIGSIGIGSKKIIEKATGNLYPSISGILFYNDFCTNTFQP